MSILLTVMWLEPPQFENVTARLSIGISFVVDGDTVGVDDDELSFFFILLKVGVGVLVSVGLGDALGVGLGVGVGVGLIEELDVAVGVCDGGGE